jgi:hypothetical protein
MLISFNLSAVLDLKSPTLRGFKSFGFAAQSAAPHGVPSSLSPGFPALGLTWPYRVLSRAVPGAICRNQPQLS